LKERENRIPSSSGGQRVLIRSGNLDSQNRNKKFHPPGNAGGLLRAQAWVGSRCGRGVVCTKRNPLPGYEQSRERWGVVEETEKGGKEGKRNLEYQLGYQSMKNGVMKTSGWKVLTDLGESCIYKVRRVTVDGNAIKRLPSRQSSPR